MSVVPTNCCATDSINMSVFNCRVKAYNHIRHVLYSWDCNLKVQWQTHHSGLASWHQVHPRRLQKISHESLSQWTDLVCFQLLVFCVFVICGSKHAEKCEPGIPVTTSLENRNSSSGHLSHSKSFMGRCRRYSAWLGKKTISGQIDLQIQIPFKHVVDSVATNCFSVVSL